MFEKESELRCAVAFWGPELAKLASDRSALVILDVSMGCTSRASLEALGVGPDTISKHASKFVRVLDGLHSKIYLGRDRCIIGSANASGNALGHGSSRPKLLEAAIVFDRADDSEAFSQIETLWQTYVDASRQVTLADRERAPRLAVTDAARDWRAESVHMNSVFEAVLHQPDNFKRAAFVFGDSNIDRYDLVEANEGYRIEFEAMPNDHRRSHVCSSDPGDPTDDVFRSAAMIINFWFGRSPGLYAYHDVVRIEHNNCVSYYGRQSWSFVGRAVGLAHLKKATVWDRDKRTARRLTKLEGERKGSRYVALPADAVSEELARLAAY
jgi:hypothetical protein